MKIAAYEIEEWERACFGWLAADHDVVFHEEALKLIASRSTGVDHMDMDYCRQHDVTVASVPSYGVNTVAERAFSPLLAVSHNVVEAAQRTDRGDFSHDGLRGFDLMGKTLGVLGTGQIGEPAGEQFAPMKDGVVLINTARGAIVDVNPLTDALASGKVAAAGLDHLPTQSIGESVA